MTDIMFAKAHMGEYFQLDGRKVQVIGYDATDKIMVASRTGRCMYAEWEDLRWL